jgi:putative membrane protein
VAFCESYLQTNINQLNRMKLKITFISRLAICALATSFAFTSYGQSEPANSGEDVSGHPTTDSPYLRARSKSSSTQPQQQQQAQATKLSQKDQKFLSQIAAGGVQEVEDAKAAASQGNESTKKIASRIAADRSSNNKELMALAKKKGVGLGTDKIKPRNMGKSNYDKQYVHTTTGDVREDLKLVQQAAQSADDKDIKAWAAKTLPMLKGHLGMLQAAK